MIKPKATDKCDKINYKEVKTDEPITIPVPPTKNKEVNKQKHDHSDAKMHD